MGGKAPHSRSQHQERARARATPPLKRASALAPSFVPTLKNMRRESPSLHDGLGISSNLRCQPRSLTLRPCLPCPRPRATILSISSGNGRCSGMRKRPCLPTTASALFTNERVVSVDLAGKSRPARCEISQNLGLRFTVRRAHQANAFGRLISTMLRAIHERNSPNSRVKIQKSMAQTTDPRG